jgi:hypothetical protein
MKIDITKRQPEVDEAIARTTNPRHLAIINNYVRHAHLEVCGWYEQLLEPDLMVEHPIYEIYNAQGHIHLDGMAPVRNQYKKITESGATVIYHTDGQLLVNDDGFITEYMSHHFWPGQSLRAAGRDIDDPSATYLVSTPLVVAWPFDERLRVAGERAYSGPSTIRKCDPAEVITVEEAREKLGPLIPRTITPEMLQATIKERSLSHA